MDKYVEIARGHVGNRGEVIPLPALISCVNKEPLYRSYYTFDEELLKHFRVYKTIKGFKGKAYLDRIIFDIDKGVNSDQQTLDKTKFFVEELMNEWKIEDELIQPWFSGRGYHIVIPEVFGFTPTSDMHEIVKNTLSHHFPIADSIYDKGRLIRVGHTLNEKAQKYKIPLSTRELFSLPLTDIQQLADRQRLDFKLCNIPENFEPFLNEFIICADKKLSVKSPTKAKDDPTSIVTCVQKMYNEGDIPGNRHIKILRMVSAFRRHGIPRIGIHAIMKDWAKSLDEYEVERAVNDVFDKGYRYSCEDKIMKNYCDPKCVFYKNKNYMLEVVSAKQMEKNFTEFVRSDFEGRAFDLGKIYNMGEFCFYPGEFIMFMGDTGLGKTAFVQNICVELTNMPILFLSLETHETLMYRRFIQICTGLTKSEVRDYYKTNTNTLSNLIGHINIMSVAPEIKSIKQLVAEVQPRILIVDTLDSIEVEYSKGDNEKLTSIVLALKAIAQTNNIIIIGIHHISKNAAYGGRLDVHSGKGPSTAEQKADKVISIEGKEKETRRLIRSLKARDEAPFSMLMQYDFNTFQYRREA